jgi:hypothetical protein
MTPYQAKCRLILLLVPATLCACGSVEPQGALKVLMKGDVFESAPRNPAEEKRIEDDKRELHRQTPTPTEKKGPVGFKIPL